MPLKSFPFNLQTGEFIPSQREAYLRGQLTPTAALAVEKYLDNNAVQTGLMLACWHELQATEEKAGRPLPAPPPWVHEQLLKQPTVSGLGPLRRPVVQLAVLLLVVLSAVSGIQWARQKPLVPEPVVAAVQQMARSVGEATSSIASSFDSQAVRQEKEAARRRQQAEELEQELAQLKQEKEVARAAQNALAAHRRPAAVEPIRLPEPRTISLTPTPEAVASTTQTPLLSDAAESARAAASATSAVVRGRIVDEQGRPLAGATVLVQGTRLGTGTDADGNYVLEAPAGATLQFGYAGYADQVLKTSAASADVTLEPVRPASRVRP